MRTPSRTRPQGHPGSYHYFVVLKASDEAQMAQHTEALLDAYLSAAPPSAHISGARYNKLHYGWEGVPTRSRAGGDECATTADQTRGDVGSGWGCPRALRVSSGASAGRRTKTSSPEG